MTLVKPGGGTHGDLDVLDILRREKWYYKCQQRKTFPTNFRRYNGFEELEVVHIERLGSPNLAL